MQPDQLPPYDARGQHQPRNDKENEDPLRVVLCTLDMAALSHVVTHALKSQTGHIRSDDCSSTAGTAVKPVASLQSSAGVWPIAWQASESIKKMQQPWPCIEQPWNMHS